MSGILVSVDSRSGRRDGSTARPGVTTRIFSVGRDVEAVVDAWARRDTGDERELLCVNPHLIKVRGTQKDPVGGNEPAQSRVLHRLAGEFVHRRRRIDR